MGTRCRQFGNTPLLLASKLGHIEIIECLLAHGADVTAVSRDGSNALSLCTQSRTSSAKTLKIVKLLLDKGVVANMLDKHVASALAKASFLGHGETVQFLLDKGPDINLQDRYGWNALLAASMNGFTDVVQLLIDRGAEVNKQMKSGCQFIWTHRSSPTPST